ncbi:MAG: hypothetical protein Q9165_007478 [Trypethelium subeluteriae]
MLCYMQGLEIRLLNSHKASSSETVVSIPQVLNRAKLDLDSTNTHVTLLNYCDEILTFLLEDYRDTSGWLMIISVADDKRRLITRRVDSSYRIFVVNDSHSLCFGTHSELGGHGHHEWIVHGIKLDSEEELDHGIGVQLENLVGGDIGSNVAFRIHNGYFYALSNQTSFELEEIDYTSFYTCMRFPLDRFCQSELRIIDDIYRRQNSEGAINDSWTDLGLQVSESTNELTIVEARREYLGNTSSHQRTYYMQPVPFPTATIDALDNDDADQRIFLSSSSQDHPFSPSLAASSSASATTAISRYPANDVYIPLITPLDKPRYAQPRPRLPRHAHPEFGPLFSLSIPTDDTSTPPPPPSSPGPSFLLWKTKHRAYNLASASFLDLVEDEDDDAVRAADGSIATVPCLRLRGAGRRRATPLDEEGWVRRPEREALTGEVLEGSEERWVYGGVRLWPPRRGAGEVGGDGEGAGAVGERARLPWGKVVNAVADERSLVYGIEDPGGGGEKIVLVSFDPGIRIGKAVERERGDAGEKDESREVEAKGKGRAEGGDAETERGVMWKEEAMYLRIAQ